MERNVDFLEYKPSLWSEVYQQEKDNLLFLLPQFKVNIEHIGATAVNSCRSFRNVDILVSTSTFNDIYSVTNVLGAKEYKEMRSLSSIDCLVLIKKHKVNGVGVTVRVVEHASDVYNRIHAFLILLKESYYRVQKYNQFRETLISQIKTIFQNITV